MQKVFSSWLNSPKIPFLITLFGIVVSLYIATQSAERINEIEVLRFKTISHEITTLVEQQIDDNVKMLRSSAAFVSATNTFTRESWHTFIRAHHIEEYYPGMLAAGYAPIIAKENRHLFEAKMAQEGFTNFKIFPSKSSYAIIPVTYIEPFNTQNQKAFGLDMNAESVRRDTMVQAIVRKNATLSPRIELVQEQDVNEKAGFILYMPVFDKEEKPVAFVYAAMKAKMLFTNIITNRYASIEVALYDGKEMKEASKLFDCNHLGEQKARFEQSITVELFGRPWTFLFKANDVLDMYQSRYVPFVEFFFGLLLSLILGKWVGTLQRTHFEAYRLADEMTQKFNQTAADMRTVFQVMHEGLLVIDSKGVVLECNAAAQELLALQEHEIVGQNVSHENWKAIKEDGTFFEPNERPAYKAFQTHQAQTNIIMGLERKKKNYIWLQVSAQPVLNHDSTDIEKVVVTLNDITEYRTSKKQLEDFVKIIDAYVITSETNMKGIITSASSAFCEISGYSKEELIGKNHRIIRHPDVPDTFYKEMWKKIAEEKVWRGEVKNRKKDGETYWVDAIIAPKYDINGLHVGYTAIRQDITDKKHIEELSITDKLTGLYNRLKLDSLFEEHLQTCKRYHIEFSIILLDIDKFKSVNDTYGHQAGDSLLQELSALLKAHIRIEDALGRWGGEEFLILLPHTPLKAASALAEKLREYIDRCAFSVVNHATASFGVTSYVEGDDADSMVKRSDKALYQAKENGRNRVMVLPYM